MKVGRVSRGQMWVALLAIGLGSSFAATFAQTDFSGITEYVFEPNPQEIKPKMYNWEVTLSKVDSQNGAYEIIQLTGLSQAGSKMVDTAPNVLIDSKMIVPDQNGIVAFRLYVGNKEPTQNMGRRGNVGQPIIFSGRGTGKGGSSWIVLPSSKVDQVVPSRKGTPLSDGRLTLIQFIGSNDRGEKFQADVILRRTGHR